MLLPLAAPPVAKKKPSDRPASDPPFERIELLVPAGWTRMIDEAAAREGLNRSAFIRQAVLLKVRTDRATS